MEDDSVRYPAGLRWYRHLNHFELIVGAREAVPRHVENCNFMSEVFGDGRKWY
jgi:hypothetical protein